KSGSRAHARRRPPVARAATVGAVDAGTYGNRGGGATRRARHHRSHRRARGGPCPAAATATAGNAADGAQPRAISGPARSRRALSNSFAIAAVTATLRNLLDQVKAPLPIDPPGDSELADAHCTARPPDKARSSEDQNQLNLFLYQTVPNAAMRNLDMPGQTQPGETGMPPLAINLYYLLTAYGKNFDDVLSHRLLGRAMSILHDRALLMPGDIQIALTNNDAWRQIERIRITPHAMSTEEISKLWAVFQTPYRVSSAYEVSVVLIDSSLPTRTPLPVLTRGPVVYPDPTPPYPTLIELDFVPPLQPSARIGDSVA